MERNFSDAVRTAKLHIENKFDLSYPLDKKEYERRLGKVKYFVKYVLRCSIAILLKSVREYNKDYSLPDELPKSYLYINKPQDNELNYTPEFTVSGRLDNDGMVTLTFVCIFKECCKNRIYYDYKTYGYNIDEQDKEMIIDEFRKLGIDCRINISNSVFSDANHSTLKIQMKKLEPHVSLSCRGDTIVRIKARRGDRKQFDEC